MHNAPAYIDLCAETFFLLFVLRIQWYSFVCIPLIYMHVVQICHDLLHCSNDFDCKEFPGSSTCAGLYDLIKLRDVVGSAVLDAFRFLIPFLAQSSGQL